jgi:hypothetical protein
MAGAAETFRAALASITLASLVTSGGARKRPRFWDDDGPAVEPVVAAEPVVAPPAPHLQGALQEYVAAGFGHDFLKHPCPLCHRVLMTRPRKLRKDRASRPARSQANMRLDHLRKVHKLTVCDWCCAYMPVDALEVHARQCHHAAGGAAVVRPSGSAMDWFLNGEQVRWRGGVARKEGCGCRTCGVCGCCDLQESTPCPMCDRVVRARVSWYVLAAGAHRGVTPLTRWQKADCRRRHSDHLRKVHRLGVALCKTCGAAAVHPEDSHPNTAHVCPFHAM